MDNDNEIFWIAVVIIAVIAIILYIIISDVARFFGAGIAVTGWALFITFVAIPLMIFTLKKFFGEIKNITLTFLSLPFLWYNWGQVLQSHAQKAYGFHISGFSYAGNLPWYGTSLFFWIIEIIFIAAAIIYFILEYYI